MTATTSVSSARGLRWAAWAGIAFAVLFVAGTLLINTPEGDASVAEWQSHFEDSGNRVELICHGYLWALAGIAFVVFLVGMRDRLRAASEWIANLALVSGVLFVSMLFLAGIATTAVAGGIEFGDLSEEGAGEFARWSEQLGFGALVLFGMFAAGMFVAATAAAGRKADLIPGWLAITGYVVAVILVVLGVFFLPMALLVLWILAVSIALLTRGRAGTTTA
jgi:hypothetical protein